MPGACAAGNNDHNTSMSKRQLAIVLWTVGILNFATNLAPLIQYQGYDTVPIWRAVHGLLNHSQIYTHGGAGDFLYFPSALLMLLPLGAVSLPLAKAGLFFVDIGAILVSTAMLLRLFGYRWFGLAGAIALCGVSFAYPVFFTVGAGNVDALVLVGFAGFLLAASSGSWTTAGTSLGLAIALKPVIAPLVLVVAVYRRWKALTLALLIPCALSGVVLLAAPASRDYFSVTLPLLWHGQDAQIQHVSYSLRSVANRLGVPDALTGLIRLSVLLASVGLFWRRYRGSQVEPQRIVELSTIVLAAAFLLSTFAFPFYGVYFLPFAIAATTRSSYLHHWLTWAALFCVAAKERWFLERLPDRMNQFLGARFILGFLLVLLSIYVGVRRAAEARVSLDLSSYERRGEARADVGTVAEP